MMISQRSNIKGRVVYGVLLGFCMVVTVPCQAVLGRWLKPAFFTSFDEVARDIKETSISARKTLAKAEVLMDKFDGHVKETKRAITHGYLSTHSPLIPALGMTVSAGIGFLVWDRLKKSDSERMRRWAAPIGLFLGVFSGGLFGSALWSVCFPR